MRGRTLAVLLVGALPAATGALAETTDRYLVVMADSSMAAGRATALVAAGGGRIYREHPDLGLFVATSIGPEFAKKLAHSPGVLGVVPDVLRPTGWGFDTYLFGTMPEEQELGPILPLEGEELWLDQSYSPVPVANTRLPTRFFYPTQWDLRKFQLDLAWAEGYTGDPSTIITVVASGLDYTHRELRHRVNLDLSRNFVPEDAQMVQDLYPGAHPIADLGIHGTYVGSMMVCNAFGMACDVPNATLVGAKWLNKDEHGRIGDLVAAIEYASSIPSDIIVIPDYIGRLHLSVTEDRAAYIAVLRAVQLAQAHGAIVLGGAWTDRNECGIDADHNGDEVIMPAEAGTTVVGATSTEDGWSRETSYGFSLIDIAAPGGQRTEDCEIPTDINIFSIGACSAFTRHVSPRPFDFSTICNFHETPIWIFSFGARPAVAHVGSVAALIEQRFPTRSNAWVLQKVFATADDVLTPGVDAFTGHGRVNAYRAVTE